VTLNVYGLQNCDTCRKAKIWLAREAIAFEFHDLRKSPISAEMLGEWLLSIGPDPLINRRGTTWRGLSDSQKAAQGDALVALILDHPAIMKRPIFVTKDHVSVGFDDRQRQALAGDVITPGTA
jgi:Spx/MgsR family transcriptional regulator